MITQNMNRCNIAIGPSLVRKLDGTVRTPTEYFPVETILKEDDGNLNVPPKNSTQMKPNNRKPISAESVRQQRLKQNLKMRMKRQNMIFKLKENEWQRNRMRELRADPKYREREKLKQRERIQKKRMNPQFREMEKFLQSNRRHKKKQDNLHPSKVIGGHSDKPAGSLLNCISRDVNLWLASHYTPKDFENEMRDNFSPAIPEIHSSSELYEVSIPQQTRNLETFVSPSSDPKLQRIPGDYEPTYPNKDSGKIHIYLNANTECFPVNSTRTLHKVVDPNSPPGNDSKRNETPINNYHPKNLKPETNISPITNTQPCPIFICEICEKSYTNKANFTRHFKNHFGQFKCSVCDKVFHMKQHLKEHSKTHGEKKFVCDKCDYRSCFNYALKRHLITKHKVLKLN